MERNFFEIPDYDGAGIYAIVNAEKLMCYVGSTKNIKKRAEQHRKSLIDGNHPNKSLQKDSNYELAFIVLQKFDDISKEDLKLAEKVYMVAMIRHDFKLYNKIPQNDKENICYSIVCDLFHRLGAYTRIEEQIKNTYKMKVGFLKARNPENRNEYIKHEKSKTSIDN